MRRPFLVVGVDDLLLFLSLLALCSVSFLSGESRLCLGGRRSLPYEKTKKGIPFR
jgi:hypothetical protein